MKRKCIPPCSLSPHDLPKSQLFTEQIGKMLFTSVGVTGLLGTQMPSAGEILETAAALSPLQEAHICLLGAQAREETMLSIFIFFFGGWTVIIIVTGSQGMDQYSWLKTKSILDTAKRQSLRVSLGKTRIYSESKTATSGWLLLSFHQWNENISRWVSEKTKQEWSWHDWAEAISWWDQQGKIYSPPLKNSL